jgi:very-short-patch-repair endonuclease
MVVMRKTNNYYALPFNPKLKDRARALRKAGNLAEVLLWNQIKGNQLLGLDFDRQKIIGHYIVDFYCAQQRVVIEVDGNSHDDKQEYDAQRDAYLMGLGLFVIHVSDNDVKSNLNNIMKMLLNHVALTNSPPLEGWQAKPDGVVL